MARVLVPSSPRGRRPGRPPSDVGVPEGRRRQVLLPELVPGREDPVPGRAVEVLVDEALVAGVRHGEDAWPAAS